jgi:hypothetical protein
MNLQLPHFACRCKVNYFYDKCRWKSFLT